MTTPALPASGSTSWDDWGVAVDTAALRAVTNVKNCGAVGDGVTSDDAAFAAAALIAQPSPSGPAALSGGIVYVPPSTAPYIVSQVLLSYGVTLHLAPGAVIQRAATDTQTGPVVLLQKFYAGLVGRGTVKCLNAAPSGIVRIDRTGASVEWCRVRDVNIQGRASSGSGDIGLAIAGDTASFQHVIDSPTINGVDTMIQMSGQANANEIRGVMGYNIYSVGYDIQTLENRVTGGFITSSSNNITVIKLSSPAQGNIIATSAEPGGTAVPYNVASGCTANTIGPGYLNCSGTPVDNGTTTTIIDRHTLSAGGGVTTPLVTKTASYTLTALTDTRVAFNGASLTATLPDPTLTGATPIGRPFVVKNLNASALTVVSAGTSKTIDGASTQSLAQWAKATYVSDGTQWLSV